MEHCAHGVYFFAGFDKFEQGGQGGFALHCLENLKIIGYCHDRADRSARVCARNQDKVGVEKIFPLTYYVPDFVDGRRVLINNLRRRLRHDLLHVLYVSVDL